MAIIEIKSVYLLDKLSFPLGGSVIFRYMGTITGIGDLDPVRWPNSHWRSVKVNGLFFPPIRSSSRFAILVLLQLYQLTWFFCSYLNA